MRFVLLLEGLTFVLGATLLGHNLGLSTMMAMSIGCTLLFSYCYSIYRSRKYFVQTGYEVAYRWALPSLRFVLAFGAFGASLWLLTAGLSVMTRLGVHGVAAGTVGAVLFLRLGCTREMLQEACEKLPRPLGRWVAIVGAV